jgi:hypothetical protein
LGAGCTMALKLGYNQGPTLLYWWANGYADFEGEQAQRVKQLIEQWFRWNRREGLPDYAQLLERAQTQVQQPVLTPQAFCSFGEDVKQRVRLAWDHALPSVAEVMLTLTPEQIQNIERRFDKNNRKFRDEFLSGTREARLKAQAKKMRERLKDVYGSVSDAQEQRLSQLLAASPYDPEVWLGERRLLQQEALQQMRALQAAKAAGAGDEQLMPRAQQALRLLQQHAERSPREAYRQQQQRVQEYNCLLSAEMHNLTSPAQRVAGREKLQRWHDDVQALQRGS